MIGTVQYSPVQSWTVIERKIFRGKVTYSEAVNVLFNSFFHGQEGFYPDLFDLVAKADPIERDKLRLCFPTEVMVFEDWEMAQSTRIFFSHYGLKVPYEGIHEV